MRYAWCLLLLVSGCDGLANVFSPFPVGAVRFTPDTSYLTMWREVEACSGRRGSMRRVEWYYYPGTKLLPGNVPAQWRSPGHDIFFADSLHGFAWRKQPAVVRHEMLHDLADAHGHPMPLFSKHGPCAGLIQEVD